MSEPVSFVEFAHILDVSPSYVTKLRDAGRLVLTEDRKKVQVEASQRRIAETESSQPQHVAGRRAHAKRRDSDPANAPPPPDGAAMPEEGSIAPAGGTRAYWERREAAARAETREIELAKLKNDLVEAAAVKDAGAEAGHIVRAIFENLPDRLAPILAEGDPERERRIYAQLREHIELALAEISHKLETIASGELS